MQVSRGRPKVVSIQLGEAQSIQLSQAQVAGCRGGACYASAPWPFPGALSGWRRWSVQRELRQCWAQKPSRQSTGATTKQPSRRQSPRRRLEKSRERPAPPGSGEWSAQNLDLLSGGNLTKQFRARQRTGAGGGAGIERDASPPSEGEEWVVSATGTCTAPR